MSTDSYISPLSERYSSKEMQHIFSQDMKFSTWRKLWIALAQTEKELGLSYVGKGKQLLIAPAVEYIHKNYTKASLSVEELAKICEISPEYFRSIFKNHFGASPIKYINNLKIERAKELISSGLYSISEAANLSGFADPCHFSREFKKTVGISPSLYTKNL